MTTEPTPTRDPDDPHLPVGPASPGWRRLDRLTILAFAMLLPLPALLMAVGLRPQAIENRALYTAPPLSPAALLDTSWYAALDRAVGDNVPFRPLAVTARSKLIMRLGGSPNAGVIRGTGNWLFPLEELSPTCTTTADATVAALDNLQASFARAGQDFRFVLAPDKHSIYPDKRRPDDGLGTPCSALRRDAVSAALDSRAWAVNGWLALAAARAAKPHGPELYFRQDTHWTTTGAMVAIRGLIESIDPSLWSDQDIVSLGPKARTMDLARLIGLPSKERANQVHVRPGVTVTIEEQAVPDVLRNSRAVFRMTASGDRPVIPGRTVIVYDSFFGMHMAEIAPFFAETVWIHRDDLVDHPDLAAVAGPSDRVIFERVERGLYLADLEAVIAPLVGGPQPASSAVPGVGGPQASAPAGE